MKSVDIRPAIPEDADVLSALAMHSKAHWGYSRDFMEACREELTVDADELRAADVDCAVAEQSGSIVGFYTVATLAESSYELDALFVEPVKIGCGIGRKLIQHAIAGIAAKGGGTLLIQGDPHATDFYRAAGAQPVGERASASVPGRFLPLFELHVPPAERQV